MENSMNEQFRNRTKAKMCIVVEEADETLFWLELFGESDLVPLMTLERIYVEAEEILKVMASYKSKLEHKLKWARITHH